MRQACRRKQHGGLFNRIFYLGEVLIVTKPVQYFVSGAAIDKLTAEYGDHLQKLTKGQLIHLLALIADQYFDNHVDLIGADDAAFTVWTTLTRACEESEDTTLGLIEAVASQLRAPLQIGSEKAIGS